MMAARISRFSDWFEESKRRDLLIRLLWGVIAAEAVLALWMSYPWMADDSRAYLTVAENLRTVGLVTSSPNDPMPFIVAPPGYPWFLNIFHIRLHLPIAAIIVAQLGMVLLAYRILSTGLTPHRRIVFLALSALYIFPLFYAAQLLSEAICMLLVAAIVATGWRAKTARDWAIVGGLVGLAALFRTDMTPIIGAVMIFAFARRGAAPALAALAAMLLVLTPYSLWNAQKFSRFTPFPVGATVGHSLFIASWEPVLTLDDLMATQGRPPTERAIASGYYGQIVAVRQQAAQAGGDLAEQAMATSAAYKRQALANIEAHPGRMVTHIANATWRLFVSDPRSFPAFARVPLTLIAILMLGLAVIGGATRAMRWPATVALAVLIPHLPLHTEARYTAAIRPILLLCATHGVVLLYRLWRQRGPVARPPKAP